VTASHLVRVGSVGWARAEWRGSFYPEDVPEDWLLPYYNTRFQAVFLPADTWRRVSAHDWARWLHDTREDFVFVLEPAAGVEPPASPRVILATPAWEARHLWWIDEAPDLRALAQRVATHAACGEPLFVFSRQGSLARLEHAAELVRVMGY
jgi:uncharacterized protein YecE (DUF72 family)